MTRYYGYYSNVARGKRKKTDADDKIPCILEPELTDKASRRNWARLIQKIYETDPLFCPRCNGSMHVIACIEDDQMIKKFSNTWTYGMSGANRGPLLMPRLLIFFPHIRSL